MLCAMSHGQPSRQFAAGYGNLALSLARNSGQSAAPAIFTANGSGVGQGNSFYRRVSAFIGSS